MAVHRGLGLPDTAFHRRGDSTPRLPSSDGRCSKPWVIPHANSRIRSQAASQFSRLPESHRISHIPHISYLLLSWCLSHKYTSRNVAAAALGRLIGKWDFKVICLTVFVLQTRRQNIWEICPKKKKKTIKNMKNWATFISLVNWEKHDFKDVGSEIILSASWCSDRNSFCL